MKRGRCMANERNGAAQQDLDLLDENALKKILNQTIGTIEDNKAQIFHIYETARDEVERTRKLLQKLKEQARLTIEEVDRLTAEEQRKKQELAAVSGNFDHYSEDRIKESYDAVRDVQVALAIARDKEKSLRTQRDQTEIRLSRLGIMLGEAEHLALAIGSVLTYLSTQVKGVVWKIETVQKDQFVGARIIKAQEEERFRISRELHDGPAQDLANMSFQTSIIEKLMDYDPDEAKHTLQDLRKQIHDCLSSVRQIIFDMRPMALDDLGLEPALRQLVQKLAARGIVHAEFQSEGRIYETSKYIEVAIFRIVQEALSNVAHHSGQDRAAVRMLYAPTAISVLITDHGCGFDADAMAAAAKKAAMEETLRQKKGEETGTPDDDLGNGHFGIVGMKERARLIGAELSVTSKPGQGTRVHLRVPIQEGAKKTVKAGKGSKGAK